MAFKGERKTDPIPEPKSLEEARKYIGAHIWKLFDDGKLYEGEVQEVDDEVELDDGSVERLGFYFYIHYRFDSQGEHVLWPELSQLLANAAKWNKNKKRKSSGEAAAADDGGAAAAAEQQGQGSKRRRSVQQQMHYADAADEDEDAEMQETAAAGSDDEEEAGAAEAAAGARGGRKRSQQAPQQQQQQHGSAGRKKQPAQQRHARDDATPDQDESSEQDECAAAAAAAAAGKGELAEQEEEEEEDEREEEEQLNSEDLDLMLCEQMNEVVNVRTKGLAGHLKSIQVQNFMCHQNFAMEFGTHVNVVSGSNGSGKSAVLQAMQCALGAQAKKTGRADKNAELVRTGCHEAKVQVTLWNTGGDAYQHRVYGDYLTVERTIKVSGQSKWRLLDHAGRKVSERKKDLDDLLDHLNIDATNPLAVMTQDTSRNFLCGAVADKKKYSLFMQATMLDSMQDNLQLAQGFVDQMKEAEKEIVSDHSKRKARVDETREKLARLEESAGLVAQMATFEAGQAWAAVEERLAKAEEIRQRLEVELPQRSMVYESLLEETEQHMNNLREKEEALAAESTQYQATQENFTAEMRRLGEELKAARLEHRNKARAAKQAEQQLANLQAELSTLLESKKESNDDQQREFVERLQQYQGQVAAAQQEVEAAQARHAQHEQQLAQLLEQRRTKEEELRNVTQRLQAAQQTVANMQHEQQQLRAANGQKLALFGAHAQLRALVDRNRRTFERVPIGPIGAHLTLTHAMWDVATEVVLGGNLETWIVHSRRDKEALFKLAVQARMRRPTVVEANFDRPPYSIPAAKQVPQGWTTLRQFVHVEHPHYAHIIDNKLMDMSHYDCAVVDQEEQRCQQAVYNRAAGVNVTKAVHVAGRSWTRSGDATTTKNYFAERRPRVGASFEAHLKSVEQALQKEQATMRELQQQVAALHGEVQQVARQVEQLQREGRQSMAARMRAQNKYTQLQTQAPVMEADGDDDDDADLAAQQCALQEQIGQAQLTHDRAKAELEQALLKQEQSKQLYESRQAEMGDMLNSMTLRQEELQAVAREKAQVQQVLDSCRADMQKLQRAVADNHTNADIVAQQIRELRQDALMVHGGTEEEGWAALAAARAGLRAHIADQLRKRIAAGRAPAMSDEEIQEQAENVYQASIKDKELAHFKKKIDELHKRVALAEQDAGGNREELQYKLSRAEAEWQRHDHRVRNMRQVVRLTDKLVRERWDKFYELFDSVSSTVSNKFMAYMHRRGHAGKVRVDQASGELRLLVKVNVQGQRNDAKKSKAVKDLKQLSGGERSFTTVAFILALGEFTESPFRAMDEFDVFMDAINRRIATQTLLEFAREKGHLQFIFLTPQDLQAVEDAKRKLAEDRNGQPVPEGFVKVVQMRPARPNQQQRQ